ncbi:MAG: formate dehydrogenase subunit gamma [Janthinobacterium lividum]
MSEVLRDTDRLDPDRGVEHRTMVQPGDTITPGSKGTPTTVSRYGPLARLNHWVVAFSLIALALSGLALYTPYLYFLTNIFGGGQTTRWLHPWIGVVLFVSFYVFFAQLWRANLFNRDDLTWVMRFKDVVAGNEARLPEMGKYNAGQKFVFWGMSALILVLIASGVVIWQEYFSVYTAIETQRWAALLHAAAAIAIILIWITHVYASIWIQGTMRAMTRGNVTAGWAYRHHRKWLKQLAGLRRKAAAQPNAVERTETGKHLGL